jgi:adenosylcobinamide kinase/adenosylcobinamide-phosphate guanylyltransferase
LQLAEALANQQAASVTYIATAQAGDAEMAERIAQHRAERPPPWGTLEVPVHLADALLQLQSGVVVIDCLTLWLSNVLLQDFDELTPRAELPTWKQERDGLLRCLAQCPASLIVVSNEVGSGIVPMSPLARRFQDEQGRLNQALAAACDHVSLVVAGIALSLKKPVERT